MNAPPSRNEQIKEASRFLRGGIEGGLSRVETGAIAEDDAQLTKFHGTYLQDDRDLRPERRKKNCRWVQRRVTR
jgi:sulfite reductase (NADPH) hemoprotein beta-component